MTALRLAPEDLEQDPVPAVPTASRPAPPVAALAPAMTDLEGESAARDRAGVVKVPSRLAGVVEEPTQTSFQQEGGRPVELWSCLVRSFALHGCQVVGFATDATRTTPGKGCFSCVWD